MATQWDKPGDTGKKDDTGKGDVGKQGGEIGKQGGQMPKEEKPFPEKKKEGDLPR
jgi:hypothetical protein